MGTKAASLLQLLLGGASKGTDCGLKVHTAAIPLQSQARRLKSARGTLCFPADSDRNECVCLPWGSSVQNSEMVVIPN